MTTGLDDARTRLAAHQPGAALLDLSGLRLETEDLEDLFGAITDAVTTQGVTELDLSGNRLVFLPQPVGRWRGLTSLRLARNALVRLPEAFGQLTALTDLDLSGNQLTLLPESFRELRAVRTLSLSGNRLAFMPESMALLNELRVLDLSANELWDVGNTVGSLVHLERLDLHGNRLSGLPSVVCLLTELQHLDLSDNRFQVRPYEVEQLPAGARIDLRGNPCERAAPVFAAPSASPGWASGSAQDRGTEISLRANYFQYYVFDEQGGSIDGAEMHDSSGDGLMAPSERSIRMVSAAQWGTIRLIVQFSDHLARPHGVAAATDLSLPSGVLCITGYEGPVLLRHDFGGPARVRILLEVTGRDNVEDGTETPPEVQRMTVVVTDRPRPRWRSVVTDRIGESLREVRDTAGPWRADDEP